MSEQKYRPEQGTEKYVHVRVTQKNGVTLAEPQIEHYYPVNYAQVAMLKGFKGDVLHDPRKAGQKPAPAVNTVKTDGKLETEADYRARYKQLFREDAPFNSSLADVKRIVDNAEKKLAEGPEGVKPVEESDAERVAREAAEAQAKADAAAGLPTNKTEWFALFQKEFPGDTTEYKDITVPQIREKLGK